MFWLRNMKIIFWYALLAKGLFTMFCFCISYNGKPNVCLEIFIRRGYNYQDLRHHPPGSLPSAGAGEFC